MGDKKYLFALSQAELEVIGQCLGNGSYRVVKAVVDSLNAQLQAAVAAEDNPGLVKPAPAPEAPAASEPAAAAPSE